MKLKDQFAATCIARGLRLSTRRSYWDWVRKFVKVANVKSVDELTAGRDARVSKFLSDESARGCAASTQAQALNALNFLFAAVLKSPLGKLEFKRPSRPARLTAVPVSHNETMRLLDAMPAPLSLVARLIYGAALRVNDCLRIRLRDLDFANGELRIMDSKGGKDRLVPLPAKLEGELRALATMREVEHAAEKRRGGGWVWLPGLYGVKNPRAHFDTGWQYLFAARKASRDPESGKYGRHHVTPEAVQSAMRLASAKLKLKRNVTPHGLRHSAARRMKERGVPLHVIQSVLGHNDPATTMRYLGLGETVPKGISPLD